MNQKLWIAGMFRGRREMLEKTVAPVMEYFNGLIAVIDSNAKPEDVEWLNSIKKDGEIIVKKWVNDHSHTMNELLFTGKMEFPDYLLYLDETDKPNPVFVKRLREDIKYWHKNNVGAVWLDHPLVLRYNDGLRFTNSPHWTATNFLGKVVHLPSTSGYRKESYIFNLRDEDKLRSAFLSPAKYWFEYPACSNQTELLYRQFSDDIWKKHEELRINFRLYCKHDLGIELKLDSLINYLKENIGKYPPFFEQVLETEVNLKDMFRLFVLNQPWEKVVENRFNYSYFKWKETGEVDQDKYNGYEGCFNVYRREKGLNWE